MNLGGVWTDVNSGRENKINSFIDETITVRQYKVEMMSNEHKIKW